MGIVPRRLQRTKENEDHFVCCDAIQVSPVGIGKYPILRSIPEKECTYRGQCHINVKTVHFVEHRPQSGVIRNSPIDIVIPDSGDSRMASGGYYKDTPGFMDDNRVKLGENVGLYERFGLVECGKDCHLRSPLLADTLELDKWLLNGVQVQVRL